eukprot:scaffold114228_cov48-Phaeocystis_antarctica.AAC.1
MERPRLRRVGSLPLQRGAVAAARALVAGHDEADDEAVEPEGLSEDEDEHHAHVHLRLHRDGTHARVAHDADGDAGGEAAHAAAQAARQVREAGVGTVLHHAIGAEGLDRVADDDGDDEAVDAEDARHHDGDDVLHHNLVRVRVPGWG